jgi:hypothetical protein
MRLYKKIEKLPGAKRGRRILLSGTVDETPKYSTMCYHVCDDTKFAPAGVSEAAQ